jgi:hypothetical protein
MPSGATATFNGNRWRCQTLERYAYLLRLLAECFIGVERNIKRLAPSIKPGTHPNFGTLGPMLHGT